MSRVQYDSADGVAVIRMDDGKANVMSIDMQSDLLEAFARAREEGSVVLLTGRPGVFSAGFDLKVMGAGDGVQIRNMVRGGFELAQTVLGHPFPVVAACSGHAVAMGLFLLLCADARIGADGDVRLTANEVAIGMTLPHAAVAILRGRLAPSTADSAAVLAEIFSPSQAVDHGLLHETVAADQLEVRAMDRARQLTQLDFGAHTGTKQRMRASLLDALAAGMRDEFGPEPVHGSGT